ncbi:MAG: hypothetical protein HZB76_06405 [Chlamydiae bacterium]|nr:hypothetical protein [Chlamydiota bacterium]
MSVKSDENITQDQTPNDPRLITFNENLEKFTTVEEKINICLEAMREALSQESSPNFKIFWHAKKSALLLFKEQMNGAMRMRFWAQYIEISDEAKRLKNIFDEQSSFASEQIDLAIESLEKEVQTYESQLINMADISLPKNCKAIQKKETIFNTVQKELNLLNVLAIKISDLRKEIIKTPMRIRFKNKFLQRLSALADIVFPKRKEQIKQVSQEFLDCVNAFAGDTFDVTKAPYYVLREEIKGLQNIAKILSLTTPVFSSTRLKLSECWDKIKLAEKDYKKESLQKENESKEHLLPIETKIEEFMKNCLNNISSKEMHLQYDDILDLMRSMYLRIEDVKSLKYKLNKIKNEFLDQEQKKQDEIKLIKKEADEVKQKEIDELKQKIQSIIDNKDLTLDDLLACQKEFLTQINLNGISKNDKHLLNKQLKNLQNKILDKKEKMLLENGSDEYKNLKEILEQKKKRRTEIKGQLDNYRKEIDCSSFDFEKAMMYREMMDDEKKNLEEINNGIAKIEEKIAQLE